jgi:hypothetical protein
MSYTVPASLGSYAGVLYKSDPSPTLSLTRLAVHPLVAVNELLAVAVGPGSTILLVIAILPTEPILQSGGFADQV